MINNIFGLGPGTYLRFCWMSFFLSLFCLSGDDTPLWDCETVLCRVDLDDKQRVYQKRCQRWCSANNDIISKQLGCEYLSLQTHHCSHEFVLPDHISHRVKLWSCFCALFFFSNLFLHFFVLLQKSTDHTNCCCVMCFFKDWTMNMIFLDTTKPVFVSFFFPASAHQIASLSLGYLLAEPY